MNRPFREQSGHMAAELAEGPGIVARQAARLRAPLRGLSRRLRERPPRAVVTCARGTSGHAATFAKHLIERHLGIAVAPSSPGTLTLYGRDQNLSRQLFPAISQSGASDDLIEQAHSTKWGGALAVALVSDEGSALAKAADLVLPMAAGRERSVAATKTFVASLSALIALVAGWMGRDGQNRTAPEDESMPVIAAGTAEADAVCLIQTFYGLAILLAERRGLDADRPRYLSKVTRTR